jgi:hypothetical protein
MAMTWKPTKSEQGKPRPAHTYRWVQKALSRGTRMSLTLKAKRKEVGITRSEMDRRREAARRAEV